MLPQVMCYFIVTGRGERLADPRMTFSEKVNEPSDLEFQYSKDMLVEFSTAASIMILINTISADWSPIGIKLEYIHAKIIKLVHSLN